MARIWPSGYACNFLYSSNRADGPIAAIAHVVKDVAYLGMNLPGIRRFYVKMADGRSTVPNKLTSLLLAAIFGLTLASGAAQPARATVATYDFDAQPPGTTTPFMITDNGVTAIFSSPADPGAFGIIAAPATLTTMSGNILIRLAGSDPLHIAFSQPVQQIELLFALATLDPTATLTLLTNVGGNTSATGTIISVSEGSLIFSGAPFSIVELNSAVPTFVLDQIIVLTAAVPEPGTLSILLSGLAALALLRRRRLAV